MLVREWMTTDVVTASPALPIAEAHDLMRSRGIRHLPVVDRGRLVGILSDRDVRAAMPSPVTTLAVGEARYLLNRLRVEEVMSRPVITIRPDAPITEAVSVLLGRRIGALPVVDGTRLAGIVTETDLLRAFAVSCAGCTAAPPPRGPASEPAPCPARPDRPQAILVPLDGTPGSESVLPAVAELARARARRVRLLRVASEPQMIETTRRDVQSALEDRRRVEEQARAYLEAVARGLPGLEVEPVVRFGNPVDEIVREAEASRAEVIAMATRRRRGLSRVLNGSIAESVERTSSVPVVLVPYGPPTG